MFARFVNLFFYFFIFYVCWICNVIGFTYELQFVICVFVLFFFVIFKLDCEIKIWISSKTLGA
jgi:hypothetical protein